MRRDRVVLLVLAAVALLVIVVAVRERRAHHALVVHASWTLTPGVLNPDVSQATIGQTICVHGWTRTIRPPSDYTTELKRKQLAEYGLHGTLSGYQEDHLISLELGGHPTDPRNLWPEPYPRAADVDQIENQLNDEVCSKRLTLAEAQRRESELKHTQG